MRSELGVLCRQLGRTVEARKYFQEALWINPKDEAAAQELSRLAVVVY